MRNDWVEMCSSIRSSEVACSLRNSRQDQQSSLGYKTILMKNIIIRTAGLPHFPRSLLDRPTIKAFQARLIERKTESKDSMMGSPVARKILRMVRTAARFGRYEIVTVIVVLCGTSIWCTLRGIGPVAMLPRQESLLLLQAFMGMTGLLALALSVIFLERRRVEAELRRLAATDPLTGLANYGKFVDALALEIKRSERTERPFALIFVDVDDLKLLNDRQGHIVGNQALCKVANVIRASCRSIDTVARFGGDEFTLILPDAEEEAAVRVADRIAKQLASRADGPHVSVSIGVAVYPRHGETSESLLSAADSGLYQVKTRCRKINGDNSSVVNIPAAMFERNVYENVLKKLKRAHQRPH
jgi:diguanylate cyclase (GGDEF)-like protein